MISIIIPSYNRVDLLPVTLDSVARAKSKLLSDIECIVVDDGSTDKSVDLIRSKYSWIKLLQQQHKGASAARNLELRKAKGKYILFLDSDDLLEPDYFEAKIEALEENDSLAGVYGPFEFFIGDNVFEEKLIVPRHTPYPLEPNPSYLSHLERLVEGWFIHPNAILWRKKILLSVGGQNEKLLINQDVDMMFRILLGGNNIAGVESGRALIRLHDGERVGEINNNVDKLLQIHDFRRSMIKDLENRGLNNLNIRESYARYCFKMWSKYYITFPEIANKFLNLSNETFPSLNVRGHWHFELLGKLLGKTNAVKFKHRLQGKQNT